MMSSAAATLLRLNISRARRLARFRSTADPSFLVAATPRRAGPPPFGTTKRVMNRPWTRRPVLYARSKSGRFRTRSVPPSVCASAVIARRRALEGRHSSASALVGNREPLSPLGPPPLEHNPAVLGRHPNAKSVRFLSAPDIRLVSALSLHSWSCEAAREPVRATRRLVGSRVGPGLAVTEPSMCIRATPGRIFNTSRRSTGVSTFPRVFNR